MPNIAAYVFTLGILTAGFPAPNQPFELRVLASHPLTGQPVTGVKVRSGQALALTGDDGVALLRVTRDPDDEGTIDVSAQLGDFKAEAASTPLPNRKEEIRAYTDKPIYQPGQTMHVRILALDPGGHAGQGREFDLRIVDQSGELSFSARLKTSRFGIASTGWEIPPNAEPGQYDIVLKTDETDHYLLRQVSIRSYELPSFRVTAAPDRPFYLLSQPARIEIRGDYLFGKPVIGGKVRVAAADNEDNPVAQGLLDSQGRFRAILNAKVELGDNQYFADCHYIAFITDPSTNRTEQRKFGIRISRAPVHIYAVRLESNPMGRRLYVTTYSPDGAPLRSNVEVANDAAVLGRGNTNRFGVTRIDLPAVTDEDDGQDLEIRAVTPDGLHARIDFPSSGGLPPYAGQVSAVWFTTDRTLYRAGQMVKCAIGSAVPGHSVFLIASNEKDEVVFAQRVRLANGRTNVEIPYDKRFGRALNVAIAAPSARGVLPTRRVYFPGPATLLLKAAPVQAIYRPGDTATLQFEASAQAALGIAIVDQSVLERASTDSAFGHSRWVEDSEARDTNLGGITEKDLLNLDPARIDDAELQLVAEVLAADKGQALVNSADDPIEDMQQAFEKAAAKTLAPVAQAIDRFYLDTLEFPHDGASLERIAGSALQTVLDPWLQPFYPRFSIRGPNTVVAFFSSGPDKQPGTADDIAALTLRRKWFAPQEALIHAALRGLSDCPASQEEFVRLLESIGLRFDALRDPWGSPMRADVTYANRFRKIRIFSPGPDRVFGSGDDFVVAEFSGSYFSVVEARMDRILADAPEFPATPDEFRSLLSRNGIGFDSLRDPWGHPYFLTFRDDQSFTDQVQPYTYAEYNGPPEERKQITPIKQTMRVVEIRSIGEDGVKGTYDDFAIATFRRILREPRPLNVEPSPQPAVTLGGAGTIAGIVLDPAGAIIPNSEIKLNDLYVTRSGREGKFVFAGLPPGKYRLTCAAPGFQKSVLEAIPVALANVTRVQLTLRIGSVSETVEVMAAVPTVNTSTASLAAHTGAFAAQAALSTPRVREYFPETLYWQPELVTDAYGRATVRVKLADSVTTWHVAVIGSTLDGRVTEASADVRAFQPFLVDLDVPPVLTAGDEISLPVVVRNYLDRAQKVTVAAKTPAELRLLKPVVQPGIVAASSSAAVVLSMRAETPASKALLRVTARGNSDADAIEKPSAIHPDGERRTAAYSSVITAGETLPLAVSTKAIAGSIQGQVKIYPSLLARILEAIEVLLEAPHGCGEQTISSTYPNLLLLQALKQAGLADEQLSERAMKYLRAGYQRVLGYQNADGGFTYWGHGDTDVALTAYALTFLADARPFITVDESVVESAGRWLSKQTVNEPAANAVRVRALARMQSADSRDLALQLGEMARHAAEYDDPYALAAMQANKPELAGPVIDRLCRAARDERGAAWWALRSNTPYHGWGRWGQVETTALAVSALTQWRKSGHADANLNKLIDRGAMFLLRSAAGNGAWATSDSPNAKDNSNLTGGWDSGVNQVRIDSCHRRLYVYDRCLAPARSRRRNASIARATCCGMSINSPTQPNSWPRPVPFRRVKPIGTSNKLKG